MTTQARLRLASISSHLRPGSASSPGSSKAISASASPSTSTSRHSSTASSKGGSEPEASRGATKSPDGGVVPQSRSGYYKYWLPIQSRWADNDQYGHVNNAQYYFLFDTVVNQYLITNCSLKPNSPTSPIGLVISSSCTYKSPLTFPSPILAALSISHIGRSSVRYRVGIFEGRYGGSTTTGPVEGKEGGKVGVELELVREEASAWGEFVHVFVDPESRRPVGIPEGIRKGLERLLVVDA